MKSKSFYFAIVLVLMASVNTLIASMSTIPNSVDDSKNRSMLVVERLPGPYLCFWWGDNIGHGSLIVCDCGPCNDRWMDNPRYPDFCMWPPI